MAGFLKASDKDHASLGRVLTSWVYKPKKSKRFIFYILGLVVALGFFFVTYGSRFLSLLEKIPETLLYIVFIALGPLLNLFKSIGKTQEWTLFERGFSVKYTTEGKGTGDEKFVLWEKFISCTYDSDSVTLIPVHKFGRKIKMRASVNAMEIYSICRERISIAQAEVLHRPTRSPKTPDTPEQRRMARLEKEYSKRSSFSSMASKSRFGK
jgi:hypothetical protein